MNNAGFGGKLVFDKAGIFDQLYVMGSYSYKVKLVNDHFLMFGISAGLYHNTINLSEYYNDPDYAIDPSLINENVSSKLKFMTDFSFVYNWKNLDAGILFSNISFGDATYEEVELKYNPVANFLFHTSYSYDISQKWTLTPLVILRGGVDIKSQFEFAARIKYIDRVWVSALFRDPGIIGFGIGGNAVKGLYIGYNFNLATNVALSAFNSHEITLGVNIGEYIGKK
jgi:type IX secretion system PorP/SprF family membrane protein